MKKHEACAWLNKLMDEQRQRKEYALQRSQERTVHDRATGKERAMTDEEINRHEDYCKGQILEAENKLEALDIAATALTK
jgi:hypothetical protein